MRHYRSFRGLSGTFNSRRVKTLAVAGVSGALGVAATTAVLRRVMTMGPLARVPAWGRALIQVGIGVLGGAGLAKITKDGDVAMGFAGGVAGFGLASLVMGLLDQPVNLGGARGGFGRRNLRGAEVREFGPGQPRLAPPVRQSPIQGVVINQRKVPAWMA